MRRLPTLALISLLLLVVPARAQQSSSSISETIERVGEAYARLYVQPVVDAVGAGLGSGLFQTAEVGRGLLPGVDLYLGVKAFGIIIPDESRSLSLTYRTTETFTYRGETYQADVTFRIEGAPTAFGEEEPGTVTAKATFETRNGRRIDTTATFALLPGVFNSSVAPLAVPQAGVGLPLLNTHLTVRYLPPVSFGNYGSIQLIGAGLRHEISAYLPVLPFNLSVQGAYQQISVEDEGRGEVTNISMIAANISVSKTLAIVTFYGGLQVERTTADVAYTFIPDDPDLEPQEIAFSLTGANTARVLAGVSLHLGPVVLNADYSQGQRRVLSAGLGLSL